MAIGFGGFRVWACPGVLPSDRFLQTQPGQTLQTQDPVPPLWVQALGPSSPGSAPTDRSSRPAPGTRLIPRAQPPGQPLWIQVPRFIPGNPDPRLCQCQASSLPWNQVGLADIGSRPAPAVPSLRLTPADLVSRPGLWMQAPGPSPAEPGTGPAWYPSSTPACRSHQRPLSDSLCWLIGERLSLLKAVYKNQKQCLLFQMHRHKFTAARIANSQDI